MSEDEKRLIMRNLTLAVGQYYRLGYCKGEVKLISWNKEARIVEWLVEDEFPPEMLDCKGDVNAESLIELLGGKTDGKVMIITDGFWTRDVETALKRWINTQLPRTLRIITIGADANTRLEGKGFDVFTAEDIFAALDSWVEKVAA